MRITKEIYKNLKHREILYEFDRKFVGHAINGTLSNAFQGTSGMGQPPQSTA